MSHSKPSATVNQKNSVLIICLHPGIRREFQDYLSALLGEYISFHILDPYQIHDPAQIRDYSCILFASSQGSISHSDTGKHYTACLHPHL